MRYTINWPLVVNRGLPFFIVFIAFFANLGGVPLFDLDEGAFAEATREMLLSGNFAATYLDGEPRYDKPIFSYWMQAISISLFGLNEWAIRLPSAIAGSLWVYVGYRFAKQQFNPTTALYFAVMMSLVLWVMIIARAGTADAWLNLFITLTVINIWRYQQSPEKRHLLATYFWMALGVLTKGPVAILVPLLTAVISFVIQKKHKLLLTALFNPLGWLVLIAVVSPWLIMVYQEQGVGFFYGFIFEHNVNRFSQTKEQHGGQWFYFVLLLPVILLPFSAACFSLIKRLKEIVKSPLEQFLLIWFTVVFVLVSVSQTQLPHYVLYGITGLVLVIAHHRKQLLNRAWHFSLPLGFMAFCTALPLLIPQFINDKMNYEMELLRQYTQYFDTQYLIICAVLLIAAFAMAFYSKWTVTKRLVAIGVLQAVMVFNVVIEGIAGLQQDPIVNAAELSRKQQKSVVAYLIKMPSFSVYREQITPNRKPLEGEWVLTKINHLESLQTSLPNAELQLVFEQGGIILVEVINVESQALSLR